MTEDLENSVSAVERGLNLSIAVRCPQCSATGRVPKAWEGCNVSCRVCGNVYRAVYKVIRAHDFKPEVKLQAQMSDVVLVCAAAWW